MENGSAGYFPGDNHDEDGDEFLAELLGGISFTSVRWAEEVNQESGVPKSMTLTPGRVDPSTIKKGRKWPLSGTTTTPKEPLGAGIHVRMETNGDEADIFQNAYHCSVQSTGRGAVERPPIQIVDFRDNNRGRGIAATRHIVKGEIIYTERPLTATQILPASKGEPIKACQTCFRSLEAWTKLIPRNQNDGATGGGGTPTELFPFPELWPVVPLEFNGNLVNCDAIDTDRSAAIRTDRWGRVQCLQCNSLFCSLPCYSTKIDHYGSCCFETKARQALPGLLREDDMKDGDQAIQAPVALATSMFLQLVHHYRVHDKTLDGHFINRVCGTADDICPLELGKRVMGDGGNAAAYTLQPLYEYLLKILEVNKHDKQTLSLHLLHSLASKAARNGVGFATQSPFSPYYAGLLRKANYGGRTSEAHHRHLQQLAAALGTDKFRRGIDREIDALVAPEILALFPLTTHCNHSCTPNAQIRSQEFADALIDVVATRDIAAGEEICISYIDLGGVGHGRRRSTFQRRKELQGRYLFQCECSACVSLDNAND
jgi:hypothetical protein